MVTPLQRRQAIQSIESGFNYQAIGPKHKSLGRALGAYQIMEANIGPWSREVLGRTVSPDEFLASEEIQDAIFDAKFGGYVDRFGEEGAAQAWFAGPGGVGKTERKDVLGTDVGSYGQKYLAALGRGGDELSGGSGDVALAGGEGDDTPSAAMQASDLLSQLRGQQEERQKTSAEQARALLDMMRPTPLTGSAPALERIAQPPSIDVNTMDIPEPTTRGELDITRKAVRQPMELLSGVGQSLTFQGPSVAGGLLPEGTPEAVRGSVGRILDIGLGAAGIAGLAEAGAAGLVGDVAEAAGMGSGSAGRLARDLQAIPEALIGTPGLVVPARVPGGAKPAKAAAPVRSAAREIPEAVADTVKLPPAEENRMRKLIARAANNNRAARQELAEMAKVNPEALAAAKRLDIDVPVDVFADNAVVRQAAGIVRAVRGSDAGAEWEDTFNNAQLRAAEIMREQGVSPDLSTQSEIVRRQLTDSIDVLRKDAQPLYEAVEKAVPVGARVMPGNTTKALNEVITNLGGLEDLTPQERRIFKVLTSDDGITYGRLMRLKDDIGNAAFKNSGPYKDANERTMRTLYGALVEDQRNFIQSAGDTAALAKLDRANDLWSQAKGLEERLVAGFGKDADGSIAAKITAALTKGAKGDIANLNGVLNVIPENLQREALLTGIDAMSRAQSGQGGFSFPRYAKLYRGLRENGEVYSRIEKAVGKDTANMMRDLYEVSVRMDRAAQNVPRTGLANQGLIGEGLIARVLDSSAGTAAKSGVGAMIGQATIPVPGVGAGVGAAAGASVKIGGRRAKAAGLLFRSPEFQRLAIEAATKGQPSAPNIRSVAKSPAYLKWAKTVGVTEPEAWLAGAFVSQQAQRDMEQQNGSE